MSDAYDCGTKTKMRRTSTCARVKSSVVPVVEPAEMSDPGSTFRTVITPSKGA